LTGNEIAEVFSKVYDIEAKYEEYHNESYRKLDYSG
jgi:hypothetical protein